MNTGVYILNTTKLSRFIQHKNPQTYMIEGIKYWSFLARFALIIEGLNFLLEVTFNHMPFLKALSKQV